MNIGHNTHYESAAMPHPYRDESLARKCRRLHLPTHTIDMPPNATERHTYGMLVQGVMPIFYRAMHA
jgi:hypothetical protein